MQSANIFKFSAELRKLMSSANRINFNLLDTSQISLMYKINTLGPKTEPYDRYLGYEMLYKIY